MKKITCLFTPFLFIASGCATRNMTPDEVRAYMGPYPCLNTNNHVGFEDIEVEIFSTPNGANIEVDGSYVGSTPIKVRRTVELVRDVSCRVSPKAVFIVAAPTRAGHCEQRKHSSGGKIHFEMALCPIPNTLNVNILP